MTKTQKLLPRPAVPQLKVVGLGGRGRRRRRRRPALALAWHGMGLSQPPFVKFESGAEKAISVWLPMRTASTRPASGKRPTARFHWHWFTTGFVQDIGPATAATRVTCGCQTISMSSGYRLTVPLHGAIGCPGPVLSDCVGLGRRRSPDRCRQSRLRRRCQQFAFALEPLWPRCASG